MLHLQQLSTCLFLLLSSLSTTCTHATPATTGEDKDILTLAAERDNAKKIQSLLDEGQNPNAETSDGESVLHLVCIWGGAKKASILLAAGANPNHRASKLASSLDMTPLSWCSYAGYHDTIAEFLKDKRTNVNLIVKREDGECMTAMDIALKIGDERGGPTQDLLRKAGAVRYEELKFLANDKLEDLLPPSGCP